MSFKMDVSNVMASTTYPLHVLSNQLIHPHVNTLQVLVVYNII